ncbi:MAG: hypothetical protein OQK24_02200 [Magnetovibrio sp.]|nr:hypothetical protein [Magnetovibrio sp.]
MKPNDYALEIGGPPIEEGETVLSLRELQSRRFDTLETKRLIEASTATLQDLGFNIQATSAEHGVISGSKDRDAIETAQVAGQVMLTILAALGGNSHQMVYDESQQINVSLVVNKIGDKSSVVRVLFDRHITNNQGVLWKADVIKDKEIYQQFFNKLAASTFLEANEI